MIFNDDLIVYSYSRCSTCRKALAWLEQRKIDFQLIDIVKHPPSLDQLRFALSVVQNRKLLFNTSGVSYRTIGAAVVNKMSDEEALKALEKDGKLIKRPLLISEKSGEVLVGFKIDIWNELYLS